MIFIMKGLVVSKLTDLPLLQLDEFMKEESNSWLVISMVYIYSVAQILRYIKYGVLGLMIVHVCLVMQKHIFLCLLCLSCICRQVVLNNYMDIGVSLSFR